MKTEEISSEELLRLADSLWTTSWSDLPRPTQVKLLTLLLDEIGATGALPGPERAEGLWETALAVAPPWLSQVLGTAENCAPKPSQPTETE